jgi:anti-sigma regulatory factor (Ser/Thr protein kinase)
LTTERRSPLLSIRLTADRTAPRRARSALDDLRGLVPPATFTDLRLLVTEVVTNSVRHTGLGDDDTIELTVRFDDGRMVVACRDRGPGYRPPEASPAAGEGWGLFLVRELADRWGIDTGEGCTTWFELDVTD